MHTVRRWQRLTPCLGHTQVTSPEAAASWEQQRLEQWNSSWLWRRSFFR